MEKKRLVSFISLILLAAVIYIVGSGRVREDKEGKVDKIDNESVKSYICPEADEDSNYGEYYVDIAATGVEIYSTVVDGYDYESGTSMSAAMVTGVAAYLYSVYEGKITAKDVKNIICDNGIKVDELKGKCRTGAYVDMDKIRDSENLIKNK